MATTRNFRTARINEDQADLSGRLSADNWGVLDGHRAAQLGCADAAAGPGGAVTVSLTTLGAAYTQNFDALASTGTTGTSLPTDWTFSETGGTGQTTYSVGTGSSTTGDTWSFGVAGTNPITDRAFGSLASGTVTQILIGTFFVNNTGATITQLAISYFGEQWRNGNNLTQQKLDFQISFTATSISDATPGVWTDVNALDFLGPIATATAGALDGNLTANRVAIASTITGLNITAGATFWIRWVDVNDAGNDHGLAIDDFSLTPTAAAGSPGSLAIDNVSHAEGNAGLTAYTFTVTRSGGSTGAVGATWTLVAPGGTGFADSGDFDGVQPTSGTVAFADGETTKTITINVQGDLVVEDLETFNVVLSLPTNGVLIGDDTGLGTITNDDVAPVPGTLSIDDVSHAEGDSGTTTYTFTVTRSGGSDGTVGATWTLNAPGGAGNADSGDFDGAQLTTGAVSFANGELSKTITILVQGDAVVETDEAFTVTLSAPTGGASLGDASGAGVITNDDVPPPVVSIADASVVEIDAANNEMVFTVTITSAPTSGFITVNFTTNDGTALAGSDYTPTSGQVVFGVGETSKEIHVPVFGDTDFEDDETFTITLSSPVGATIGDGTATGTIVNNDPAPAGTLSIDDVSHGEGDVGSTTTFTFTVTRSGGTAGPVAANWAISALGGAGEASTSDFVAGSVFAGTVSFADGETSKTISIDVAGDVAFEADETFTVTLSGATGGAGIGDGTGTGTIVNDDLAPPAGSVSIADVSIVEGNAGTSVLTVTLTRIGGTAAFDVNYATSNGGNPNNASATAGSDYLAASGTVSFADGQNIATIQITINGDTLAELSEEFTITLSGATNGATLSDATAIATITTDDAASAAPANAWINEFHYDNSGGDTGEFIEIAGAAGINLAEYSIVRYNGNVPGAAVVYTSPAQTTTLTGTIPNQGGTGFGTFVVNFATDGLQNGGNDGFALVRTVAGVPTVLEFWSYEGVATASNGAAAGMTSIDVGVIEPGDAAGTSIARTSGPPGATWVVGTATPGAINTGQILPGGGAAVPGIAVSDVSVNEAAGTMTFTVTRTNVAAGAFTIDYATANGTATAGSDYTATSGTLSFTDNQVQAQVTVAINNDGTPELNETILLNLSNATGGATIADNQGVGTIVNDDGTPIQVSINDVSIVEGNAGTSILTFTVTRTGGTGAFDVNFGTADGTAVAPGDYLANSGTLSFGVGQNSQTVSITINGDLITESNETFQVLLSGATNDAIIVDGAGTGTIVNDEPSFIHDIQGTSYYSPILAGDGISGFNIASTTVVSVRAVVTAVDNVGNRQGYYLSEEITDWDGNSFTSEGIFVMTRNDAGVGTVVSGVSVGDLVQISANVMEYQSFNTMPRTTLVNSTGPQIISTGNALPTVTLTNMINDVMTLVTPDYSDSSDGVGDTFDASLYALSYFETVEGMLVTIPNMVVADGFVQTSGGDPYLQAYSLDSANPDQINSRGGYTIAGDPPIGPPDTPETGDDTHNGGRVLHDGDVNPDIIELDFTDFASAPPTGLLQNATMGEMLGDVTGIIDFDFTDRKLFVTSMEPGGFVDTGNPVQETTLLGDDGRALTVATFNVENLDPGDGAARFTALANAIANNLNAPDIVCIEEMQDNNGATASGGADASTTWQMLVDALNLATGGHYQWVDQEPNGAEGGEPGGNIRVGFLYNTDRVQLGNLDANATLADRRMYTDRIGDGTRDAGDLIAFSDNMLGGEINTADWTTTRKSLLGEFTFHGNTVYVTANHWPAKGGSGEFWQFNQNLGAGEPDNSDWAQRSQVGQDVYSMLNLIEQSAPGVGIASGGDYNDFYFYRPLTTVTGYTNADGTARVGGARFDNLTLTLSEAERYTYTFDGRSQAIDHIIVNNMLSGVASYDVVHLNTGYNSRGSGPNANPALSDHDPAVSSFDYRNFSERLLGTGGSDAIDGFGGNDSINGLGGADLLTGGAGADYLDGGGGGVDVLQGGADNDVIIVDGDDQVVEAGGGGYDNVAAKVTYVLAAGQEVEVLSTTNNAGTAAIDLTGNAFGQVLVGNDGINRLDGGGGADQLVGLGGNDLFVVDSDDRVYEAVGGGLDRVEAMASFILGVGQEVEELATANAAATSALNLGGNEFGQTLTGNAGANYLDGGGGMDQLAGLGGNDAIIVDADDQVVEAVGGGYDNVAAKVSYVLQAGQEIEVLSTTDNGGAAAINLTGNAFGQVLVGNAGANILDGGLGNDILQGLGGADTFQFTTALGAGNVDTIVDFVSGTDKIALDDAVFTGLTPGALPAGAFVTGTAALDADDRIIYNCTTGALSFDADGVGGAAAVQFATLSGLPALAAGDFTVI